MKHSPHLLLSDVSAYYANKIAEHGATPRGVDWNGAISQETRFDQLCKVIGPRQELFTVSDIGCGYGALLDYLLIKYKSFDYLGVDICQDMVEAAGKLHSTKSNARFASSVETVPNSDFCIASGIFNVRLERTNGEWLEYIEKMLEILNRASGSGFAFNCLTMYSDADKKRDYLYYADPALLFNICKTRYSKNVALLHDYNLYEFTILVRK